MQVLEGLEGVPDPVRDYLSFFVFLTMEFAFILFCFIYLTFSFNGIIRTGKQNVIE